MSSAESSDVDGSSVDNSSVDNSSVDNSSVDNSSVERIQIRDEAIRLGQLLKLAGVVQDGAMARMVIENREVTVDGEIVARRGTQIRPGMIVRYEGATLTPSDTGSL